MLRAKNIPSEPVNSCGQLMRNVYTSIILPLNPRSLRVKIKQTKINDDFATGGNTNTHLLSANLFASNTYILFPIPIKGMKNGTEAPCPCKKAMNGNKKQAPIANDNLLFQTNKANTLFTPVPITKTITADGNGTTKRIDCITTAMAIKSDPRTNKLVDIIYYILPTNKH